MRTILNIPNNVARWIQRIVYIFSQNEPWKFVFLWILFSTVWRQNHDYCPGCPSLSSKLLKNTGIYPIHLTLDKQEKDNINYHCLC